MKPPKKTTKKPETKLDVGYVQDCWIGLCEAQECLPDLSQLQKARELRKTFHKLENTIHRLRDHVEKVTGKDLFADDQDVHETLFVE